MAYKVQYTPQDDYRYPSVKKYEKGRWGRIGICLLLVLFAFIIACNGIPDFLIPGDPVITKNAALEMVSSMKNGTAVKEAVYTFCKQILEGAGV